MVRKSSKLISSASPSDSCRRFLGEPEPGVRGSPQTPLPNPSHPQHGFRAALSLRFSINVSFSTWSHPRLEGEDPCPAPSHFQRINLPSLPAGGFSPLVKEGVDDFPPDWVELQVGNAVKVLLAAEGTETAPSVREMERSENPESH